ncbi:Methionyl-tRNA formyltransferase [hydrothermal vent metagenome]|uniref:methionyl-tRNA formyltransferase n=1 Tax=hydrothermal vent metagenome TaxID=652676 RepID=A0A3B0UJA4_9ZZZZ
MPGKRLRIIFMGTPDFAVESLKALIENGYNIVGVVTAPDKPAGRGKQIVQSAVKRYADGERLKVLQPEKLKDPGFLYELKSLNADLQVVVAFRMLPEVVWAMPRLGSFNLHASLLPQYRGAAPLNWVIINGETETGVTTFLLDRQIDTGRILFKERIPIGSNDTVGDIHDRLMKIGATLVIKTVDALAKGDIQPLSQEELLQPAIELKHAPRIFKEDCKIDWGKDTESIRNLIRGLSPYPAAWTNLTDTESGKAIHTKIYFAEKETTTDKKKPGEIASDGKTYLRIACGNGWLRITDLQLAGKKRMKIENFLRGFQQPEKYLAK